MTAPVDPELFLWCSNIYSVAAHMSMPVENPASRPAFEYDDQVYAFADIPMNRGMLAVMKEMSERGCSVAEKQAMCGRLMHFGEIFAGHPQLAPYFKPADEDGAIMVSEALVRACATARLQVVGGSFRFDIDDVARIAAELTAAEESAESGPAESPRA